MGKDLKGKELGSGFSQRQDGLYYFRIARPDGKRKTIYAKTERDIKIKYNEIVYIKDQLSDRYTVRQWTEKFIKIYKSEIRETTRIRIHRLANKMIYPYLGDRDLNDITNMDIMEWIGILKQSYKSSTVNKALSFLKEIFFYAIYNELAVKNPCSIVKALRVEEKAYKVFTKNDQKDFEEYMSGRFFYPLVIIALNTGLRVGEAGGLQISDIDMDKRIISVNKTLLYEKFLGDTKKVYRLNPPKTKNSKRIIPMNDRCYEAMCLQLKRREVVLEKNSGLISNDFKNYLFLTTEGHPVYAGYINSVLNSAISEINKCRLSDDQIHNISFHLLRHSFATRGFEAGITIKTMQKLLGHSTIKMTMDIYTHVFDDVKNDEIAKLNGFLKENKLPEASFIGENGIDFEKSTVPKSTSELVS